MLLAIVAFSLSLLGTFLVRSGVLTSVHAFATDPKRGIFILVLPRDRHRRLARAVRLARAAASAWAAAFELVSRESLLLANNVLLVVAAGSVLLGTLYPLFLDALGLGKISVGPPYFDAVFVAADGAGDVPDGRRAARALEAGQPAASWRCGCAGRSRRASPRRWSIPLVGRRVDAAGQPRTAAGAVDRRRRRRQPVGDADDGRRLARAGARAVRRDRAATTACSWRTSASPCSSSASRSSRATGRERRAHGGRRPGAASAATRSRSAACSEVERAELPGRAGGHRGLAQRPAARGRCIPRSASTRVAATPMTEAAIDYRAVPRPLCVARRAAGRRRLEVRIHYKPFVDWIWGGAF